MRAVGNPPSSGGGLFGSVEVDFGVTPTNEATAVITGKTGITANSNISVWIQADDTTADNNAAAHNSLSLWAVCTAVDRVVGVGFTVQITLLSGYATGRFKFHYTHD